MTNSIMLDGPIHLDIPLYLQRILFHGNQICPHRSHIPGDSIRGLKLCPGAYASDGVTELYTVYNLQYWLINSKLPKFPLATELYPPIPSIYTRAFNYASIHYDVTISDVNVGFLFIKPIQNYFAIKPAYIYNF